MKELTPSSAIPLAYYAFAHLSFAAACLALVIDPGLPSGSFYQPRVVALVHLVTIPWISGSILGSFYVVAPLALRVPMPAGREDWVAFAAFAAGAAGLVSHFWISTYDGMAWSGLLVTAAIAWVGIRGWRGLSQSPVPPAVVLHVRLAFLNMLVAAAFGLLIGVDRSRGFLGVSPLASMFAHVHIAAVGWAAMMVIGLSYRLISMILPAAMPTGRSLARSALLIETGLVVLVPTLLTNSRLTWVGSLLIVTGIASFVGEIRRTVAHRLPRPPALPSRDWSTWQAHGAFLWLFVAATAGITLSTGFASGSRLPIMWIYGVAGLIGFLSQIVTGMQGRLVPLYAWYRAFAARGAPPDVAANALPSAAFARPIFLLWSVGVPLLAWGLPAANQLVIRLAAAALLAGVCLGMVYLVYMLRRATRTASPRA
jgi:hypothetical protein